MKNFTKMICAFAIVSMATQASMLFAQNGTVAGTQVVAGDCATGNCGHSGCLGGTNGDCGPAAHTPCPYVGPSNDCIGAVGPGGQRYMPARAFGYAATDHFSPCPLYTYGSAGLDATRTDYWNRNTAAPNYAWHGDYQYWRWGAPTALVVPPTASFQTEYNWGVAQTRSMPIYHQFTGGANAGFAMGGAPGVFRRTPYWPSSTSQFGIYPVRAPW